MANGHLSQRKLGRQMDVAAGRELRHRERLQPWKPGPSGLGRPGDWAGRRSSPSWRLPCGGPCLDLLKRFYGFKEEEEMITPPKFEAMSRTLGKGLRKWWNLSWSLRGFGFLKGESSEKEQFVRKKNILEYITWWTKWRPFNFSLLKYFTVWLLIWF